MQNVVPTFRIEDYARSRRFYVDGLGFRIDWEWRAEPHDPVFARITRDGLALYLSERPADGRTGALVHLYVADVDAWAAELAQRGVAISAPADEPWGNRELRLTDPDGNQICVCTRLFRPRP